MSPAAGLLLATVPVAQVFAALGPDPAYAGIFNFALLIYIATFTRREVRANRRDIAALIAQNADLTGRLVAQAEELARTARGSEARAENAAAEITATKAKIEDAAAQMVVLGRAIRDKLALIRVEREMLEDTVRAGDSPDRVRPAMDRSPDPQPPPRAQP